MNSEMLSMIIKTVITVLIMILTTTVIPYIKEKMGEDAYAELIRCIEYAVRCAEQLYTPEQWSEKKEYVAGYITRKAHEMSLNLSEEDINVLIEGIVNTVKH